MKLDQELAALLSSAPLHSHGSSLRNDAAGSKAAHAGSPEEAAAKQQQNRSKSGGVRKEGRGKVVLEVDVGGSVRGGERAA
eukprot:816299-Rhodomonas_salina.1